MTGMSHVDQQDSEVRSVDHLVVAEVRRQLSSPSKLRLQRGEVSYGHSVVSCGITSRLWAKLLGCLPSADYQIRPIGRRRVRDMPATLCPPVVGAIGQV